MKSAIALPSRQVLSLPVRLRMSSGVTLTVYQERVWLRPTHLDNQTSQRHPHSSQDAAFRLSASILS